MCHSIVWGSKNAQRPTNGGESNIMEEVCQIKGQEKWRWRNFCFSSLCHLFRAIPGKLGIDPIRISLSVLVFRKCRSASNQTVEFDTLNLGKEREPGGSDNWRASNEEHSRNGNHLQQSSTPVLTGNTKAGLNFEVETPIENGIRIRIAEHHLSPLAEWFAVKNESEDDSLWKRIESWVGETLLHTRSYLRALCWSDWGTA